MLIPVPGSMSTELALTATMARGYQINTDTLLIDRRRLKRQLRKAGNPYRFNREGIYWRNRPWVRGA